MSRHAPWLDSAPPPDPATLDRDELIEVWSNNRNNLMGAMAADEMMKRLKAERKPKETTT